MYDLMQVFHSSNLSLYVRPSSFSVKQNLMFGVSCVGTIPSPSHKERWHVLLRSTSAQMISSHKDELLRSTTTQFDYLTIIQQQQHQHRGHKIYPALIDTKNKCLIILKNIGTLCWIHYYLTFKLPKYDKISLFYTS